MVFDTKRYKSIILTFDDVSFYISFLGVIYMGDVYTVSVISIKSNEMRRFNSEDTIWQGFLKYHIEYCCDTAQTQHNWRDNIFELTGKD